MAAVAVPSPASLDTRVSSPPSRSDLSALSAGSSRVGMHNNAEAGPSVPTAPPELASPSGSGGLFARRGSLMPGSRAIAGESAVNKPARADPRRAKDVQEEIAMTEVANRAKDKQEMAMAKWRKWAETQPHPSSSPRNSSIESEMGAVATRRSPISMPGSPSRRGSPSGKGRRPVSPGDPGSSAAPSPSTATATTIELEYNTDSIRALRDVELAIDEAMLRSGAVHRSSSVGVAIGGLSGQDNPFLELCPRLGSRRVRPIVVELIQALSHYIDALWSFQRPDEPLPWTEQAPPSLAAPSTQVWRSKALSAVQVGKQTGHVPNQRAGSDLQFWADEVGHTLQDVDDVVGMCKGLGRAFTVAMRKGAYGDFSPRNTITDDGHPAGYIRLLSDLEMAIWGNAQPRPTDLAYELPIDFDPYAAPDPADLLIASPVPAATMLDFLSSSTPSRLQSPLAIDMASMPDFADTHLEFRQSVDLMPDRSRPVGKGHTRYDSIDAALAGPDPGAELSLEEFGKRRHKEWLAGRNSISVPA